MSEYIYGKNIIIEAIKSKREIIKIFISDKKTDIMDLAIKNNIPCEIVRKEVLDSFVKENHQGVVAKVHEYSYYSLENIVTDKNNSLIVALDGIEDPHNLGAIIRTVEISGCDGIILPVNRNVKVNGTVEKVSAGALEYVKVAQVVNLVSSLKKLKELGYWIVGAEYTDKSQNYWDIDMNMKICLVIGSEGRGVSRLVKEECDYLVKIPMWGKVNSLNASVSAALVIYEIRRQQNK